MTNKEIFNVLLKKFRERVPGWVSKEVEACMLQIKQNHGMTMTQAIEILNDFGGYTRATLEEIGQYCKFHKSEVRHKHPYYFRAVCEQKASEPKVIYRGGKLKLNLVRKR